MRLALGGALILIGLVLASLTAFLVWAHLMFTVDSDRPQLILIFAAAVALVVGCTTTGVWVLISRRWRAIEPSAELDP